MIHIDDLFRQRMEDREASPKPGAWGNMRQLLDKEMPVVQAASNWRRVFGYFTGALLLVSASVGGYSLYSDQLYSNAGTAPSALAASNTRIASGLAATSGIDGLNQRRGASASNRIAAATSTLSAGSLNDPAFANAGTAGAAASGTSSQEHSTRSAVSGSGARRFSNQNPESSSAAPSQSGMTVAAGPDETASRTGQQVLAAASRNASPSRPAAAGAIPSPAPAERPRAARATTNNVPNSSEASRHQEALPLALNSSQPGTNVTHPAPALRILDTIRRIEIITRREYMAGSRRPVFRLDTLPAEYTVIERLVPLKPEVPAIALSTKPSGPSRGTPPASGTAGKPSQAVAGSATPAPVPVAPAASVDAATDAATTANEVAAKLSGTKLNFWQSLRLDEKVEAAKQSLQSIQLYPGVIAGINATMFTPNSLGGFQLGLTSLIALNDNWSVLGELKYIHRFNTGSTLRDDYTRIDDASTSVVEVNGAPHTRYAWSETRADHYFNYESIQTIELPIAFRYNNNRFFTQAGINLVSSRPINAREVTNFADPKAATPAYVPVGSSINPMPADTKPTIMSSDFGSRFNIGYVFGAGYMFTPSVYLDCRMTQSFWNNAATPGAKQISRDLLGRPSFQLSVGYRFGTGKQD